MPPRLTIPGLPEPGPDNDTRRLLHDHNLSTAEAARLAGQVVDEHAGNLLKAGPHSYTTNIFSPEFTFESLAIDRQNVAAAADALNTSNEYFGEHAFDGAGAEHGRRVNMFGPVGNRQRQNPEERPTFTPDQIERNRIAAWASRVLGPADRQRLQRRLSDPATADKAFQDISDLYHGKHKP